MIYQVLALIGAFCLALAITPIFRLFAIRVGLVDSPDAKRKLHTESIALSGGVAVLLSCLASAAIAWFVAPNIRIAVSNAPLPVIGITTSSLGVVFLGLIDDWITIRGRQKLLGQIVLVSWLVYSGFQFENFAFLGFEINLGFFAIPISIGWLLLTINSLNLIDGADGFCSTIGFVASLAISAMAMLTNNPIEAAIAASLAGALIGFLVFNLPPAKIFLGDAGSMLVGLILGALAMRTHLKEATAISLIGPMAVLAIPLLDSGMAILRRKLTGRSIFAVDRGHLHHAMLRRGYSSRKLVAVVLILSTTISLGAFAGVLLNNNLITLASVALVFSALVLKDVFGRAELLLLRNRSLNLAKSFASKATRNLEKVEQIQSHLQGDRQWQLLWETVVEFAVKHELSRVCLDLNVPWLHEGFHASWKKRCNRAAEQKWTMKLPVISAERPVGRIEISSFLSDCSAHEAIREMADLLEDLQPEIDRLCSDTDPASITSEFTDKDQNHPIVSTATSGFQSQNI